MQEDWVEELGSILSGANLNEDSDHIFMMFSATFPAKYRGIAKKYMANDYLRIKAGRCGATHANIKQKVMWVDGNRCLFQTKNQDGKVVFDQGVMTFE